MVYQLIHQSLVEETKAKAQKSSRRRMNYNFHDLQESYQRFLNVLLKGTYVRPHRHFQVPKPETFLALQGELGFLLFQEDGTIAESFYLSSKGPNFGIDIQPGIWHAIVCLSDVCVCFEGKLGPYNPNTDKEFHPSYPEEGSEEAKKIVQEWERIFQNQTFLQH